MEMKRKLEIEEWTLFSGCLAPDDLPGTHADDLKRRIWRVVAAHAALQACTLDTQKYLAENDIRHALRMLCIAVARLQLDIRTRRNPPVIPDAPVSLSAVLEQITALDAAESRSRALGCAEIALGLLLAITGMPIHGKKSVLEA
jgi:hypothetical protein